MSASAILSALNTPIAVGGGAVSDDRTPADGAFADLLATEAAEAVVVPAPIPPKADKAPPPPVGDGEIDSDTLQGGASAQTILFATLPIPLVADGAIAEGAAVPEQPSSAPSVGNDKTPAPTVAVPSEASDLPETTAATTDIPVAPPVAEDAAPPVAPVAGALDRLARSGAEIVKAALAAGGPASAPARVTGLRSPLVADATAEPAATAEAPPALTGASADPDAALPVASTFMASSMSAPRTALTGTDRATNALVDASTADDLAQDGPAATGAHSSSSPQPASGTTTAGTTVAALPVVEPIIAPAPTTIEAPANAATAPTSETSASTPPVAETSLSSLSRATIETTAQLAAQITRRLEGRSTRFEMALTPDGLGRVDVSLDIDADGQLAARLAFDNPLAATDMRGRADELRRQLEEAGFTLARDALEFSGRDGSSGGGQAFDRRQGRATAYATRHAAVEAEALTTPAPWIHPNQTPRGVDVKV